MQFQPHEYQAYAIDYILQHPVAALFLECGLGKTVICLTAGTIDEKIRAVLWAKDQDQAALIEAVKAEIGMIEEDALHDC